MPIVRSTIMRNPNVGLYSLATDEFFILPSNVLDRKASVFKKNLKTDMIKANIGGSLLNGVLAVANSNGIVLPHFASKDEIEKNHMHDKVITIIRCKETAIGNLVLANDNGAIACPSLTPSAIKSIEDALGVEVEKGTIAGLPIVGALAVATNKGALAHPSLTEREKTILEDLLKVPVDVGTVNCGVPFIKSGLVANSYGAVVGNITTGPELSTISAVLQV